MLRTLFATWGMICIFAALTAAAQGEVPPSEQLFPASTKAYLSVANMPQAVKAFEATPLGRLLRDAVARACVDIHGIAGHEIVNPEMPGDVSLAL